MSEKREGVYVPGTMPSHIPSPRVWALASRVLGIATLVAWTACASTAEPTTPPPPKASAKSQPPRDAAHDLLTSAPPSICPGQQRLISFLTEADTPAAPAPATASSASAGHEHEHEKEVASKDLYGTVAPATVIVRTENGMGTGIIVDKDGWVLTAYHVVKADRKDDFTIKASVELGAIAKEGALKGVMQRNEKTYEAVVYKVDAGHDLALMKLTDPPPNLPTVHVAHHDVKPGEPISLVGNAGIGMLWAVKTGTVSSAGALDKSLASLVMLECTPGMPEDDCASRKKAREHAVADMAAMPAGVMIQSTIPATRGDSGGPVVDGAGDLVGMVSFTKTDTTTSVVYSYHVHISEIRTFLSHRPAKPAQVVPNPFCDGGEQAVLEDADLDGKVETLVTSHFAFDDRYFSSHSQRRAMLFDLDQDHFVKTAARAGERPTFDAEVAVLQSSEGSYIYYDTDGDNRFDILLFDKHGGGSPESVWRIAADGSLASEPAKKWRRNLEPDAFKDASMGERLTKIGALAVPGWAYVTENAETEVLPDPLALGGRKATLVDLDYDGKPDAVSIKGAFSQAFLVDVDGNSLSKLKLEDDAAPLVKSAGLDAELAVVEQGDHRWVFYDTNGDDKLDLVLHGAGDDLALGVTSVAWKVDGKQRVVQPEHVGRLLVRPALVGAGAKRLKNLSRFYATASDDGLGSLPNPITSVRYGRFSYMALKSWPRTVASAGSWQSSALLLDVDRNTKIDPKEKTPDAGRAVTAGSFDAEFAQLSSGQARWAYYDTDDDGAFDFVLFASGERSSDEQVAYRVTASGALQLDAAAAKGKWVRGSLFTKKPVLGAQLKRLAKDVFRAEQIEN